MDIHNYRSAYYNSMAEKLFHYLNGKINTINNNCTLTLSSYDTYQGGFGKIVFPNHVVLFMQNIIDNFDPAWESEGLDETQFTITTLALVICHELFHADQVIGSIYKTEELHQKYVEDPVEASSYMYVYDHKDELSRLVGIQLIPEAIMPPDCMQKKIADYKALDAETFYKQTVRNIILRDEKAFNNMELFSDPKYAKNIVILFNNVECITIKADGKYYEENINRFADLVYKYASKYDAYTVKWTEYETEDYFNGPISVLAINIVDPCYIPFECKG